MRFRGPIPGEVTHECPNPWLHARGRLGPRLSFVVILVCALLGVDVASGHDTPNPPHPARWKSLDGPRVPVAGSVGVVKEHHTALLGGFTDRLEATAAVQIRDPRHGWMPVGTALLEPRAEASAIPLDDGTWLVIGGWSGHLPDATSPSGTAERCDPWNPQRRRAIPPPFPDRVDEGLEGHAACRLADGRVLLVHDRDGVLFDPHRDSWSRPFPLAGTRRGATLVPLAAATEDVFEVLAIGGGGSGEHAAIETIRIESQSRVSTEAWNDSDLPSGLTGSAAIQVMLDGRIELVLVAGGLHEGTSTSETWVLEASTNRVRPGPSLPIEGGVMNARLSVQDHRLVLIGGERRHEGRPLPVRNGAVLNRRLDRAWSLPPLPTSGVRGTVLDIAADRSLELVGGYRFDRTAPRGSRTQVLDLDTRLELPRLLVED